MVLDQFDATGNVDDLRKNLPIAVGVVEAYRQRFPNKDRHGKIDMFPAQALEGYRRRQINNKYRGRVCKKLEMTGFYHTILKFPESGPPDMY